MPEDLATLVHLGTLGLAYNQLEGEVYVLFLWNNFSVSSSHTGYIGPSLPPKLQVADVDHNYFTSVDPAICDYPAVPAFKNEGGCASDWLTQPLGT